MAEKQLCPNLWHRRRGRRRGWGRTVDYFWKLPTQNSPFWPELLHVCSRWRSCRGCPAATSVPSVPTPAPTHPKGCPCLKFLSCPFLAESGTVHPQHWILALPKEFTGMKSHQLSQREGQTPQGMQEAQLHVQRWMCHYSPTSVPSLTALSSA